VIGLEVAIEVLGIDVLFWSGILPGSQLESQ